VNELKVKVASFACTGKHKDQISRVTEAIDRFKISNKDLMDESFMEDLYHQQSKHSTLSQLSKSRDKSSLDSKQQSRYLWKEKNAN